MMITQSSAYSRTPHRYYNYALKHVALKHWFWVPLPKNKNVKIFTLVKLFWEPKSQLHMILLKFRIHYWSLVSPANRFHKNMKFSFSFFFLFGFCLTWNIHFVCSSSVTSEFCISLWCHQNPWQNSFPGALF